VRSRTLVILACLVVTSGAIAAFLATRPTPHDAFPAAPPSASIAPDGARVFTIHAGTQVWLHAGAIRPGDVIACAGKGRTVVPDYGNEVEGSISVFIDPDGDVTASCEPHPPAEI